MCNHGVMAVAMNQQGFKLPNEHHVYSFALQGLPINMLSLLFLLLGYCSVNVQAFTIPAAVFLLVVLFGVIPLVVQVRALAMQRRSCFT